MQNVIDATDLIATQRALRDRLLSRRSAISGDLARDLAARMLLHLDEPTVCLDLGAHWLLRMTDADRADVGLVTRESSQYSPAVEAKRPDAAIPSVCDVTFCAADKGIQEVLEAREPVVFDDILHDGRISPNTRQQLSRIGTRRKIAVTLRDADAPIGMLCVDRVVTFQGWSQAAYVAIENVAGAVVAPIVAASLRLRGAVSCRANTSGIELEASRLTAAELRVARLVVEGHSYKEIARRLDRSIATVDHHLRNIRDKLGVSSTSKLVFVLNKNIAEKDRQPCVRRA